MNEFEYYLIESRVNKAYPLVAPEKASDHTNLYIGDNFSIYHETEIPNPKTMEFVFQDPIPRKPVIGDYFSGNSESIVSQKMADVLNAKAIEGIQLIPATILNPLK